MPPKSTAKVKSPSTNKCRRSARIAYRIKSMVKGESASSKGQPSSTKERGNSPLRKKSVAKRASLQDGQPPSTKENGKTPCSKNSAAKRKPVSANEGQSTSTIESTVKRRRNATVMELDEIDELAMEMEMDEISERASQMGLEEQENFSAAIQRLLGELSPDLEISEEAIADMNIYLNHVLERLARTSEMLLHERNSDDLSMTVEIIESAILRVIKGDLGKFCFAEGRRALRKSIE